MNNRIKKIRSENHLTQVEFGLRIGVKGNTITNYENGLRTPSDAVIKLICQEFYINEHWLRTGEGSAYIVESQEMRFAKNIARLQRTDNETIMNWVNAIAETNPEMLTGIETFFKNVLGIK